LVDRKAQISATILSNQVVAAYTNRMQISAPAWAAHTHAGHFVNVLLPQAGELLWRRPYSVHGANRALGTIELLFNTTGRGSRALSLLTAGCSLELLGLLGNTFTFPENMQQVVIVAGGLGIAPFRLLLQDLADRPIRKTVFYGASTAARLCCLPELSELGAEVHISTDDGTAGNKGFVAADLEKHISVATHPGSMLYVCGPTPMMRQVQELAQRYRLTGQVTVENKMACGFGACMGCPVELAYPQPDGKRYLLACKDGPVFSLDEILLND
jgi:dihydroorotate dehydrogenase electron transfer subunit